MPNYQIQVKKMNVFLIRAEFIVGVIFFVGLSLKKDSSAEALELYRQHYRICTVILQKVCQISTKMPGKVPEFRQFYRAMLYKV